MPDPVPDPRSLRRVLERLPRTPCLMTAAHDGRREAVLVQWVTQCACEPAQMCVALRTGQPIEPLIQESRAFGLCRVDASDPVYKQFEPDTPHEGDPLAAFSVTTLETDSPLLVDAEMAVDCRVVRHLDLESDHALYVGVVVRVLGRMNDELASDK